MARAGRGMAAAVWAFLLASSACGPEAPAGLTAEGEMEVRAVERDYVAAWRANDPEAVMRTLTSDAVLLPGGISPVRGTEAIRDFWWPPEGPVTTVTDYETEIAEVGGQVDLAFMRGTGRLRFRWEDGAESGEASSRSAWLALLRRDSDGSWRMTHRTWYRLAGDD